MNGNVIRTITIRGTSEGLDKLQGDLAKVAAAHKGVTVATEETEKSTLSFEQTLKRQALRLDEVARAQNNIERETKIANRALKEGLIDQQRHAELLTLASQRYTTGSKATQEFGKQTGLARHELINLGRQAQDVGVSLVSGQSPLMVLAQQGSQIADVFISSGKSVGDFFSQAIGWAGRFLLSTTGIVTAVGAVAAAAVYMGYQFLKSSTTVEEALEKQKSLMDATKTSIGELIDAQIKLQSVETARFEGLRNQEDLQQKLIKSAGYLAELSVRRTTSPLQDIGAALGIGPAADPSGGYEKIAVAVEKLKAAAASGTPDVVAFRNEVAGIGEAARTSDPGVAKFAETILKNSLEALNLETSLLKARAALQSVAQSNLNNLGAKEAADAAERLAVAATNILNTYPGITVETAKTLANLTSQMTTQEQNNVKVQLEGDFRRINATYQEEINRLLREGLILTSAVADAEQNRQAAIAAAVRNATQLNAVQAQVNKAQMGYNELYHTYGQEEADRTTERIEDRQTEGRTAGQIYRDDIKNSKESANAKQREMDQRMEAHRREEEQTEQAHANAMAATEARINAYKRAEAAAIDEAYAVEMIARAAQRALDAVLKFVPLSAFNIGRGADDMFQSNQGGYSQFNPGGYTSETLPGMTLRKMFEGSGIDPNTGQPTAQQDPMLYFNAKFNKALTGAGGDPFGAVGSLISQGGVFTGGETDPQRLAQIDRLINLMSPEQQIGSIQGLIGQLGAAPQNLQTAELTKQLNDRLADLTRATDDNTSATSTMTDVLSPFYSSDPRSTHLGFRAFAGGGIMTEYGALPLRQYQGGGMATSPQVAVFGEGSTPEAYVPVPSGRIPVEIKQPANSNQRPVQVTINVMGNADAGTIAALKQTSFQKAQQLRRVTG